MRIAFIGAGVMGEAMISALLRGQIVGQGDICACDVDSARLNYIGKEYKVNCTPDIRSAIRDSEVVVLSIKPQSLAEVMNDLKGELREKQLLLSIVAGAKIDTIRKRLGHGRVIRAMPNIPAHVGEGISVWTATDVVSQKQKDMVQNILRTLGREMYVPNDKQIDMATAVSGSGPAYIFLIMEALIDAAVHIGLPRVMAEELVLQTVLGSAHMIRESGKHPAELKNSVTSPGGTTAEGLLCLEEGGVRALLAQAVIAAYEKAQILGDEVIK